MGEQAGDPHAAAERFLENSGSVGIDVGLMWATVAGGDRQDQPVLVRQVSLAVIGAGGTAMMFVSGPGRRPLIRRGADPLGGPGLAAVERAAVLRAACRCVADGAHGHDPARLAQALLEPHEKEALAAFLDAGFTRVGDLAYLRRSGTQPPRWEPLPEGVRLRSVADLHGSGLPVADLDAAIAALLEETYIDTADCPELCGLRSAEEVLASHRAVGRYDPALWWLVFEHEKPVGCALFNIVSELESVELVYLGLAPAVRGRGLGARVLERGLRQLLGWSDAEAGSEAEQRGRVLVGSGGVTCAVDTRNAPALGLYRRAGFQRFSIRVPVVKGLGGNAGPA